VFLVDTDVISEARKGDAGVREFFRNARQNNISRSMANCRRRILRDPPISEEKYFYSGG
jgi:hypothetical protein